MARVECELEFGTEENDYGKEIACVTAICSRCEHEVMSFGDSEDSVKRCLALMREECPNGERNFYVTDDDD